eukprot:CAMPEP_0173443578 /NCGR_PEP_ID=MMETSP1357-20121228/30190_1 /TAXON_ID=77926 /ORGANISM="Hemiselmis rufescens, Strain PCC563" /LENGTH=80 /DNA_ID=CAMNT_0014409499 /DNA_START=15 /DNA_END=254 /DNA_ORIENTATION=+
MVAEEYRRYVELTHDALKMRRESHNLDKVVERQKEKLSALEEEMDNMLARMKEVERLFENLSNLKIDASDLAGCEAEDGD